MTMLSIHTVHFLAAITGPQKAVRHAAGLRALRFGADVTTRNIEIALLCGDEEIKHSFSALALLALRVATFKKRNGVRAEGESLLAHIRLQLGRNAFKKAADHAVKNIHDMRGDISPAMLTGGRGQGSEKQNHAMIDGAMVLLAKAAKRELLTRGAYCQRATLGRKKAARTKAKTGLHR